MGRHLGLGVGIYYMVWQETFRAAAPTTAGMLREDQIDYDMLSVLVGRVCPTDDEASIQMTMYEDEEEGAVQTGILESDGELFGFRVSFSQDDKLTVEVDVVDEDDQELLA